MTEFPKTLAAARNAEKSQWNIGDAILEECGPPGEDNSNNGSWQKIEAASKALHLEGLEYAANSLRIYRDVCYSFPLARRLASVSFSVHVEAGSPEMLNKIIAELEHGERLTLALSREISKEIRNKSKPILVTNAWKGVPSTAPSSPASASTSPTSPTSPPPILSGILISKANEALRIADEITKALEGKNIKPEVRDVLVELSLSIHNSFLKIANGLRDNNNPRSHIAMVS